MKQLITSILVAMIMIVPSYVFAGEVLIENAWFGRHGNTIQFVKLQTTDNQDYNYYVNGRYAFSIYVPKSFTIAQLPQNGDGCNFFDEYGSAFTVSGSHNLGTTLKERYNKALYEHPNAAYADIGSDWYVISYLENGNIVYEKHFLNEDYVNTWRFVYPKWLAAEYNQKCTDIETTFTPGWKTGYKILG